MAHRLRRWITAVHTSWSAFCIQNLWASEYNYYCIYPYKRPGGDAFFKRVGGRVLQIKTNQLSSRVAMGDNGHLHL